MYLIVVAKCSDCCYTELTKDGNIIKEHDGYVPYDLGIGGGDYIRLRIDVETGKIFDWDSQSVKDWINKEEV